MSPGPVDTEFSKSSNLEVNPDWAKLYNAMPKLKSDDVADAVLYVLSTPPHVQVSRVETKAWFSCYNLPLQVQEVMLRPLGEPV